MQQYLVVQACEKHLRCTRRRSSNGCLTHSYYQRSDNRTTALFAKRRIGARRAWLVHYTGAWGMLPMSLPNGICLWLMFGEAIGPQWSEHSLSAGLPADSRRLQGKSKLHSF